MVRIRPHSSPRISPTPPATAMPAPPRRNSMPMLRPKIEPGSGGPAYGLIPGKAKMRMATMPIRLPSALRNSQIAITISRSGLFIVFASFTGLIDGLTPKLMAASGHFHTRFFGWPLLGPHAKEEAHDVEGSDQQFVQGHDQDKGDGGDDRILRQNAYAPGYDKPTDAKDDRLLARSENYLPARYLSPRLVTLPAPLMSWVTLGLP